MTQQFLNRHLVIPDTQVRPGVYTDHLDWIGQAILDYKPTRVIHLGDHFDFPSLSAWDKPGSANMEGARYLEDVESGNDAFEKISAPMMREIKRQIFRKLKNPWNPSRDFIFGNHENRVNRAISAEPKYTGAMGLHHCITNGWRRHDFLEKLELDGVCYSHYFQSNNSPHAIGGSADNMLNKIGVTHTMGHRQGFQYGTRVYPSGITRHSLVAGSCYTHKEDYRGAQGQRHWRGIVIKNEVKSGDYNIMPLSLDYLSRKYEKMSLFDFMNKKHRGEDWRHLQ